ncbi:MAG: site-2 protease family protein [Acidimicrobiia bacterium]
MPLGDAAILFGCLVTAVIFHEVSHGVVALWFGDDTAKRAGRLTLNPVPHVDPFGSILLPAMGALAGLPILGYAKPVPVNPARLRRPRRDLVYVSLAGPTTNFLLMAIAALGARWRHSAGYELSGSFDDLHGDVLLKVLLFFATVNLLLGLFNFLPIPPLDGSALIERVLPEDWLPAWYRFRPYGLIVLIVLVFSTNIIGHIAEPFFDLLDGFIFR